MPVLRQTFLYLSILVVVGQPVAAQAGAPRDTFSVSDAWLAAHLADTSVIVLDARGEGGYRKGHVPGAVPIDWQECADMSGSPKKPGYGEILDPAALSRVLERKGVHPARTVVVCGDPVGGWGEDGYIVWALRMAGISRARLLDGGITYWKAGGLAVTRKADSPRPADFTIEAYDSTWLATTAYVKANLEKVQIIDTRSEKEFGGKTPYGEARGGHLPGAVHVHYREVYRRDGRLLPPDQLASLFASRGLSKDTTVVAYCTGGVRSGLMVLALRMAGFARSRNYDGSAWGWAADASLPLE